MAAQKCNVTRAADSDIAPGPARARPAGFDLSGRAILVTEATSPIGRALTVGFQTAGADVFVSARRPADLAAARRDLPDLAGLPGEPADLTRPGEADRLIQAAVARLGRLDVLAGTYQRVFAKPLTSILDEEYARVIDLNLRPAFAAARAAVPLLAASGTGRILLLSSGLAVRGLANGSVFCAAQGALG
ncbi:MAG TPA: SDR family NAD(P)-dependent oxidoreductase, partial [Dehalococcoidia bacterium]|nr:SDR family NAD(P)-dependent oxidoreductase [Dehalococcoidia bacterium]